MMRAPRISGAVGSASCGTRIGEFVAAEPCGGVGSAQALADALGRLDQQPVAGQVAEAVVDELELVDVEEQHGDLAVRALGSCKCVIEAIDEERAVRQPREGICQGLPHRVGRARR